MARSSYFSGDLVGINDAMASEELNRIRGRSSNQQFLGGLVSESTKRRGQDTQERIAGGRNAAEERIAGGRNATELEMQNSRTGAVRYATDAVKEKNASELQQAIQNYQLERERLGQFKANSVNLTALENRKVDAAILANADQGRNLVEIAKLNLEAAKNRFSPQGERAVFEANADVDAFNSDADAAADAANATLSQKLDDEKPWLRTMSAETTAKWARAAYIGMSPEQQAQVELIQTVTKDANGKQIVTPSFRPRLRRRMSLGTPPASQGSAPAAAAPAASALPALPGAPVGPMADGFVPASIQQPATSIFDLVRGAQSNPGMIGGGAPSIRSAPPVQQAGPSLEELISMALPQMPRENPGQRAVVLNPGVRARQEPGNRAVTPFTPRGEFGESTSVPQFDLQGLIEASQRMAAQPPPEFQGPPQRMYDPRLPLTEFFNPTQGLYQGPDGRFYEFPPPRAASPAASPRRSVETSVPQSDLRGFIEASLAAARQAQAPQRDPQMFIGPR